MNSVSIFEEHIQTQKKLMDLRIVGLVGANSYHFVIKVLDLLY